MGDSFICADCGKEFDQVWSIEEAVEEAKENFGEHVMKSPTETICDGCFEAFMRGVNN